MSNKLPLVDEFEKTLNELDSELDNIQKCAQEILQKVYVIFLTKKKKYVI
jgi:hypothetical protein